MRVIAIVQARMGSSRLPGKVLAELGGATMLAQVVRRLRTARRLDEIVVATTSTAADDAVVREAGRLGAGVHRGAEHDVLARYLGAARSYRADAIVRVTADCPLIDGAVVDRVIGALADDVDYASNTVVRRYPRGLDAEALHRDTLERIGRMARTPAAREHVTALVREQPAWFCTADVVPASDVDDSDLRWTVDTDADLAMARGLYDALGLADAAIGYRDVVAAVRARPELAALNAHVIQKPWQDCHVA